MRLSKFSTPIFNWDKFRLNILSQFFNMSIQYFSFMQSRSIFHTPGILSMASTSHLFSSHINFFFTFFIFLLFSHNLSLRSFLYKPILFSIEHKAFPLIFLAVYQTFSPKTSSATSQIIFLKLCHSYSTFSNFKLSSLVFYFSRKFLSQIPIPTQMQQTIAITVFFSCTIFSFGRIPSIPVSTNMCVTVS